MSREFPLSTHLHWNVDWCSLCLVGLVWVATWLIPCLQLLLYGRHLSCSRHLRPVALKVVPLPFFDVS